MLKRQAFSRISPNFAPSLKISPALFSKVSLDLKTGMVYQNTIHSFYKEIPLVVANNLALGESMQNMDLIILVRLKFLISLQFSRVNRNAFCTFAQQALI